MDEREMLKQFLDFMQWRVLSLNREIEITEAIETFLAKYQPERSKREDLSCCSRFYVEYDPKWKIPDGYENLKPDGMRCSEHDGNIMRKVP
jgi:hypothetical protein